MSSQIATVGRLIFDSRHPVYFTGAGISTGSGLADYRGPNGVWTRRDQGLPPPAQRISLKEAQPNAGHMALFHLWQMGHLKFLISQNVDNLHRKSGIADDCLAELHGNSALLRCLGCDLRLSHTEAGWNQRRYGRGYLTDTPVLGQPACPRCDGRLISSVVNFSDPLPEKELEQAERHSLLSDVYVVIGSTLVVHPAADFPAMAAENGATLIIINRGETALDDIAHLRLDGDASQNLQGILDEILDLTLNNA